MAGSLVGRECKLYLNSGSYGTPTLAEVENAVDVNVAMGKSYGEVSSRASAWRKQKPALKDLTITFGYRYQAVVTDADFDTLHDNAIADTATELFVLDGGSATSGVEGFRAFVDLAFTEGQPLEDGVLCEFTGVHVYYNDAGTVRDPSWYEVA